MNAANEHEKIRFLLSLAASGALDSADEVSVASHVRNCPECAAELEQGPSEDRREPRQSEERDQNFERGVALVSGTMGCADEGHSSLQDDR